MGQLTPINLTSGSNRSRHDFEATARLINCYRESLGPGAKHQFALYAINGWSSYATLTGASGGVGAMLSLDTELLVSAGRQVYSVSPSQTVTLVGGFASDGLTTMARNRQSPNPQAVIVRDGQWAYYQDGTLTLGSDPDLRAPIYVIEKDGYFIFLAADGTITISGIDAITIDGLDFANAQRDSDGGVALATRGNDVLIFGQRSTEFWVNTGAADFPFEPQTYRGYGCYAAGSVSEITALVGGTMVDSVVWCATDEQGAFSGVYLLSGYEGQKISTYEIDRIIGDDPMPKNIRSYGWTEDGHSFVAITGTSYTWVYDTVERAWHERKSADLDYWRVSAHASFDGKVLFGDSEGGTLYQSDRSLFDAVGTNVDMQMWLPITHAWPYNLVCNRLRADAVTGVGLTSTDTHLSDPQIMMDVSRDGGRHFGAVRHRPLGADGQNLRVPEWHGLGMIPGQGMVIRLRISAGVRRCVMGVAIDAERLAA